MLQQYIVRLSYIQDFFLKARRPTWKFLKKFLDRGGTKQQSSALVLLKLLGMPSGSALSGAAISAVLAALADSLFIFTSK